MRLFTSLVSLLASLFGPVIAIWRSRKDPGMLIHSILLLAAQLEELGVFKPDFSKESLEELNIRDLDKIYAEVRALALRNGVKA